MGIKVVFNGESNPICQGKGPEAIASYLKTKEQSWNELKNICEPAVELSAVLSDLGYDIDAMDSLMPEIAKDIHRGYWTSDDEVDFGLTFNEDGAFLLNFNCRMRDPERVIFPDKKRCYFWRVYKYHVDISQITLRGWVDWCNELYEIQHGKKRPKNNRIFINPDMTIATVKARSWNKDRIEKWLSDHGYQWTQTVDTKYQWAIDNPDDVILVDSDEELKKRIHKPA